MRETERDRERERERASQSSREIEREREIGLAPQFVVLSPSFAQGRSGIWASGGREHTSKLRGQKLGSEEGGGGRGREERQGREAGKRGREERQGREAGKGMGMGSIFQNYRGESPSKINSEYLCISISLYLSIYIYIFICLWVDFRPWF